MQEAPARGGSGDLTLDDMKAVAREVGIDPVLIERAAALVPRTAALTGLERVIGGPVKYALEKSFSKPLDKEQVDRLVPAIRESARQFGVIEDDPSGLAWRSGAEPSQIFVTATREGDSTRIRVTSDRGGGLVLTSFLSVLSGVMAAGITGAVVDPASAAVGAGIVAGGITGGLALARTTWALTSRSVQAKLDAIMDGVSRAMDRNE